MDKIYVKLYRVSLQKLETDYNAEKDQKRKQFIKRLIGIKKQLLQIEENYGKNNQEKKQDKKQDKKHDQDNQDEDQDLLNILNDNLDETDQSQEKIIRNNDANMKLAERLNSDVTIQKSKMNSKTFIKPFYE